MIRYLLSVLLFIIFFPAAWALSSHDAELKTVAYFDRVKNDPNQLYMFLQEMPKGGDLHNHLSGSIYAEHLIHYSKTDHFCVESDVSLSNNPQCPLQQSLAMAQDQPDLYNRIINNWSMRNFIASNQSNRDHFFAVFPKISSVVSNHIGQLLAEIAGRTGEQHGSYVEIMLTPYDLDLVGPQGDTASALGAEVGWDNDFVALRTKLLNRGLMQIVDQIPKRLDIAENVMRKQLRCDTPSADAGCHVVVRYQYLGLRGSSPERLFAQLVTAFEAAQKDPRIVGVNIAAPEDGPVAVRDYDLHMSMFDYLHKAYPNVHISLHAGEFGMTDVSPEALRFHIRHAIETGHAERIGHGVSVAYEDHAVQLLKDMAKRQTMVEINLTSNDTLLNVRGKEHPLALYLHYHVPVALSTDDEGILRTHMTNEYRRAVLEQHVDYPTLKMLARNSITYSFLPGASLWQNATAIQPIKACSSDQLGSQSPSAACQQFLAKSEKANLQWKLEHQFSEFELTESTVH